VTDGGERVCAEAPHAQRVLVPGAKLFPVPDGVSDEDASWFTLAAIAQSGLAKVDLGKGDAVVVVGAGVLGQLVAQLARVAGAGKVIVISRSRPRLEVAAAHGATQVVAADVATAEEEVKALTDGGASAVFEVTGNPSAFAGSLKLARIGGTVVLLGDAGDPGEQRLGRELLNNDLRVAGAHIRNTDGATRRRMANEFFAALQARTVVVDDLVTTRSRPEEAPAVYASLGDGDPNRLGVVFNWT
jgi:threonine dehydrogenase-like Zn-dependent dehydrogenase